ncbi:MAG: GHKL domain-containing protein [Clostridiaceae bacterium]|nr:GHKL domain-containing protein [Clostridiaceae bacterium]
MLITLTTFFGLIRFGFSLIFGVALSICFAGVEHNWKNNIAGAWICLLLLFVQTFTWWLFGIDITSKLYPVIIHLPMILFLTLYFKRPWLISIVSVLSAYLCCQVPRWIGSIGGAIFKNALAEHITYIFAVFAAFYFYYKYVADTLILLMGKSAKTCILLGAVPMFYYLFDYITTIYTDLLYQSVSGAVQFMPSVFSIFYFVFIILYYVEMQKQTIAQRERDMMAAQLHGAQSELATLRQMQDLAAAYRHDMRHHFAILQGMAMDGNIEKIKSYLNAARSDIDAITPIRFCENETVNLILSTFYTKAKNAGVTMKVDTRLSGSMPLSDTELCSLLSNALENAIMAASACHYSNRFVTAKETVHKSNLLILIENSYTGKIVMKEGLPQSSAEGHGYGTRSIAAIADAYNGHAIFSAINGIFTLKIMLPMRE